MWIEVLLLLLDQSFNVVMTISCLPRSKIFFFWEPWNLIQLKVFGCRCLKESVMHLRL